LAGGLCYNALASVLQRSLLSILYKGMKPDQKARVNGVEFGGLLKIGSHNSTCWFEHFSLE
jgi:hypothetical protein